MSIERLPFLQATIPQSYQGIGASNRRVESQYTPKERAGSSQGYYGGYSAQDYETALKIAEGNYNVGAVNPYSYTSAPVQSVNSTEKGALWGEGFNIPQNNGTGELSPDVSERYDSIEDCPWKAYYA